MATDFYSDFHVPVVETDKGKVRGFFEKGVYKFRGIKYANAKRYCSPEEVEPWDGVKDCLAYGKVAPTIEGRGTAYETMGILVEYRWMPEDEDCQYINVWTQSIDGSQKKPVMVWLHGGGFFCGSSIEFNAYEAENLCQDGGVVVVSLNHRLNILGFLDLSDYGEQYHNSGNLGMEDIVAALRWVQKNIASFGGDPDNVTIFGHSGGGMKCTALMQIPAAAGLFHKAVIQSGVNSNDVFRVTPEKSRKVGRAIVEEIGGLDKLLTARFRDISDAYLKVYPELWKERLGEWAPVENDWYLGDPCYVEPTEKFKTTPIIIGTCIAEPLMWEGKYYDATVSDDKKIEFIRERYGEHTEAMLKLFKKAYPGKDILDLRYLDTEFRPHVLKYIDKRAAVSSAPTYAYMLAYDFSLNGGTPAYHSCEHSLVFRSTDCMAIMQEPCIEQLCNEISMSWCSFTYNGDPNNKYLPERWLTCEGGDRNTYVFDKRSRCADELDKDMYDYMEKNCPIHVGPFD